MSKITPGLLAFAERLIAHDTAGTTLSKSKANAFPVCEKLRAPLGVLMGGTGFQALLSRALTLSKKDVSWVGKIEVNPEGFLVGLEENFLKVSLDEWHDGKVFLVARLLELLVAFIGEDLTLNLVQDVWPRMPRRDLNLDNGE